MKSMHIGTEHEVIKRVLPRLPEVVRLLNITGAWSSGLCSSLENANGLGAAESSLATRFPLTSTERMSVLHARTGRDLCSHQMYIGRNALDVKVCSQTQLCQVATEGGGGTQKAEYLFWSTHPV